MSEGSATQRSDSNEVELRVGMVLPTPDPSTRRPAVAAAAVRVKLSVFCRALADVLATSGVSKVTHRTFTTYTQLLEAVYAGDVQLAWLPPKVAARAVVDDEITPLVVPIRGEHAWYSSALFSASGSAIRSIEDLKDVRVAWVDPESMAGYLVIRAWLRSQGIDLDVAFAEEGFLGDHKQVVSAVLDGRVDVGATYAHREAQGDTISTAGWGDADVQVVAVAGRIPGDVLAVRANLDSAQSEALRVALTEMQGALRGAALALFEADRFVPADADAMQSLSELVAHLDP